MIEDRSRTSGAVISAQREPDSAAGTRRWPMPVQDPHIQRHSLFRAAWLAVNVLLILSVILAAYSAGWEFSTRRYLEGFSDAIVPATSPGDEKVEAILSWMAHGPARRNSGVEASQSDRDPTDTLNYDALLRVCGTATNAFINLVDTGGIAKAKADGKYRGRPADPQLPGEIRRLSESMGPAAIAKHLGVARSTVYRLLGQAA